MSTDARTRAQRIDHTASRAAAQVDELLDVARLQLARFELDRSTVDLVGLTRDAIAEVQAATDSTPLHIEVLDDALVGEWDVPRLQRVVDNLWACIKYSPDGGVVRSRWQVRRGGQAELTIADQGWAYPKPTCRTCSSAFHRGSNVSDGSAAAGSDCQLQAIVESHGGTLRVGASPSGRG